jgi:hypothetical protein
LHPFKDFGWFIGQPEAIEKRDSRISMDDLTNFFAGIQLKGSVYEEQPLAILLIDV